MKIFQNLLFIQALLFTLYGCWNLKEADQSITPDPKSSTGELMGKMRTVYGDMIIKFYPVKAPNTVARISFLIRKGFYDGKAFHKVIPDTLVSTGKASKNHSQLNLGKGIPFEKNDLYFEFGSLAMERETGNDSSDSEFFIALTPKTKWNENFTIFGKVVEGKELLLKLSSGDKILSFTLL